MNLRQFYIRRIFRLWPTIAVLLAITYSVNLIAPPHAFLNWAELSRQSLSVLFGIYTLLGSGSYYFGAMWSLSVEEQFYLSAPFIMVFFCYLFRDSWRSRLLRIILSISLMMVINRFLLCFVPEFGERITFQPLKYLAKYKFDFLVYGVALFLITNGRGILSNYQRTVPRLAMIIGLAAPLFIAYQGGSPFDVNNMHESPWLFSVGLGIAGIGFTLVVGIAGSDQNLLQMPGWLDSILLYLGSRSYGIYAYHFTLFVVGWLPINAFAPWIFYKPPLWYGVTQALVTIPIILIFSELSYRFVEQPCIRLSSRLIEKMQKPLVAPAEDAEQPTECVNRAA